MTNGRTGYGTAFLLADTYKRRDRSTGQDTEYSILLTAGHVLVDGDCLVKSLSLFHPVEQDERKEHRRRSIRIERDDYPPDQINEGWYRVNVKEDYGPGQGDFGAIYVRKDKMDAYMLDVKCSYGKGEGLCISSPVSGDVGTGRRNRTAITVAGFISEVNERRNDISKLLQSEGHIYALAPEDIATQPQLDRVSVHTANTLSGESGSPIFLRLSSVQTPRPVVAIHVGSKVCDWESLGLIGVDQRLVKPNSRTNVGAPVTQRIMETVLNGSFDPTKGKK